MREKLIELLYENNVRCDQKVEGLADDICDLIANCVTVQQWISVKDRLPDMRHDVLVSQTWWNERKPAQIGWYNEVTGNWYILKEDGYVINNKVTHWMPLPQPPKGE